jgi:hypothetical protein
MSIFDFFWPFRHPKSPPKPAFITRVALSRFWKRGKGFMSTATLNWINPTTRVDGSALPAASIGQVLIMDDTGSGPTQIGASPGAATSFATQALAAGGHSFSVVVQDTNQQNSAPSNIATLTVPVVLPALPSAATGLTATLNP